MYNLFDNLASHLSHIRQVLGGGSLSSSKEFNKDYIELAINLNDVEIPGIDQDRENLRNDRNTVSKAYSKALHEKKLELEPK